MCEALLLRSEPSAGFLLYVEHSCRFRSPLMSHAKDGDACYVDLRWAY